MSPRHYHNEFDPYAAQWIRNLIAAGHLPPGDVDERSIVDVRPDDLKGYTQCHFFAGIAGWSLAARLAGWPDDRELWTGSCPCQPFSAAGKKSGFDDERHLWPVFFGLIAERRPASIAGEQVASKDADPWIDLVQADLEAVGYAFGAVAFPSAGVGAPHIRDRTFWLADADNARLERRRVSAERAAQRAVGAGGVAGGLADSARERRDRGQDPAGAHGRAGAETGGALVWLDDAASARHTWAVENPEGNTRHEARLRVLGEGCGQDRSGRPGPVNGLWRDADWLGCTDGKWRPVEPGSFPLAHGISNRVGRLRAYGNAINPQAGAEVLAVLMDACP